MARLRLLSDEQWAQLLALPSDEREIARHCSLGSEDLALIAAKRAPHKRLGLALLLCALRHPRRALEPGEILPPALVADVARQIGTDPTALAVWAGRDQTRREQLAQLMQRHGFKSFERGSRVRSRLGSCPPPKLVASRPNA